MAKDFSAIYSSGNDAIALEQKIFIKEEVVNGTLEAALATDLIIINSGAQVTRVSDFESSPVRSGRHHASIIENKESTSWTIPSLFHIDSSLGVAADTEIDLGYRCLLKSLYGREALGPLTYDSPLAPTKTFSIFNNGDLWAQQAPASFVLGRTVELPGDGQATQEYTGASKTAYLVGVGKTIVANDGGNTITVTDADEAERFPVGAMVMLIEADGVTRSADTPSGSPRVVTSVSGAIVTVDGAVLADADGSGADLFLAYYEPEGPFAAINDPQTGLQGTISIVGLSQSCVRSASLSQQNNHELVDYCYGSKVLQAPFFVPGDRFTNELTLELNLNHDLVEFLNKKLDFPGDDITLVLGDPAGRRANWAIPKMMFPVPEIPIPETGSIPISFTGTALTTDSTGDSADEVIESYL